MILVIFGVVVVFLVIGIVLKHFSCRWDDIGECVTSISLVVGIAVMAVMGGLLYSNTQLMTIDSRIAMYEEENTKIEKQIDELVKQYQQYESDTFAQTSSESSVQLVSLYPELKADTLVQAQIDIYTENNKTIRRLKDEKLRGAVVKWWLYFGN